MRVLVADHPDCMAPDHGLEERLLRDGLAAEYGDIEVVVHPYLAAEPGAHEAFLAELARADALLTGFLALPAEVLEAAPDLRCISINATGYDLVDLDAARRLGTAVMCIGEYCTEDVAEHTIALMTGLVRNLKHFWVDVDHHARWSYQSAPPNTRLQDQTLGIVGLGRIGSAVGRRAQGLGMRVIATDPFIDPAHADGLGVELTTPAQVFARSDVVSNHMNANETNLGYFDAAAFAAMERRPVFLNTARGSAVVEADLVAALDAGQVRAAGVDVLRDELPDLATHPLAHRDNVVITPHSAFYSTASVDALMRVSCANIVHFLTGRHDLVFKRVA